MQRQSEPRAGNHQRHTHTRNASLPTQANHTVRGACSTDGGFLIREHKTYTPSCSSFCRGGKGNPRTRAQHSMLSQLVKPCNMLLAMQETPPPAQKFLAPLLLVTHRHLSHNASELQSHQPRQAVQGTHEQAESATAVQLYADNAIAPPMGTHLGLILSQRAQNT